VTPARNSAAPEFEELIPHARIQATIRYGKCRVTRNALPVIELHEWVNLDMPEFRKRRRLALVIIVVNGSILSAGNPKR
jgi:hypothetical protein